VKRRRLVLAAAGACLCFAVLFIHSWMQERNKGAYFMTYLWGGPFFLSLLVLVFRIRAKE
jgi:hypothetical protein